MQSLNCKSLKITFLGTIPHFIAMRIFFTTKFCINCFLQSVTTATEQMQKILVLDYKKYSFQNTKIFKYKPLKMDSESTQNDVDLKNKKMQASHCDNCMFCLRLSYITVFDCIHQITSKNALKLQWENGHSEYL